MDFLNDPSQVAYYFFIYHGLLGIVIVLSLIQGRSSRDLLWIAGTLLIHGGAAALILYFFAPTSNVHNTIVFLCSINIMASVLLVGLCVIFLKRQPGFRLQFTLALMIILLLLRVSYFLEWLLPPLRTENFNEYMPLMHILDVLILLLLIGGVISGFIKAKQEVLLASGSQGVSQ